MARLDPLQHTASCTGVAEPHQSTVAAVLAAVQQGDLSAADAELMIDQVRAHVAALPIRHHRKDTS